MKQVQKPKKPIIFYYVIALIVILLLNLLLFPRLLEPKVTEVDYGKFLQMVDNNEISEVQIQSNEIIFSDKSSPANYYKTGVMNDYKLVDRLYEAGITEFGTPIIEQMSPLMEFLLTWVIPIVVMVALGQWLMKRMTSKMMGGMGNAMSFGKSNAKVYVQSETGIKFADVAGEDEAKEILQEIVDFLHNPKKYEEIGAKLVLYLNVEGVLTAGIMPVTEEDEFDDGFYVVVAKEEYDEKAETFESFDGASEMTEETVSSMMTDIDDELAQIQDEEASKMLSELRTESSSVYVKKKDKYTDLKFSGISFIVFGLLGLGLLALNLFEYINLFNKFSSLIMAVVFVIFFIVGITSLLRAKKMKSMVSQEERASDDVLDWIEANITDEYISSLINEEETEEKNYFTAHSAMCNKVKEQFPLFNENYIDELMDERYNEYCDSIN